MEGHQKDTRVHRESSEQSRQEVLLLKRQLESGQATVRFELESARAENARLTQVIESLRTEMERIKKENSEVKFCSFVKISFFDIYSTSTLLNMYSYVKYFRVGNTIYENDMHL